MKSIFIALFLISTALQAQYQVLSVAGAEPNQTIVTRYDKGYIVKTSGDRIEGNIQLKVKKSDTIEVRFKGDKGKEVFARNQIKEFGLLKTVDDYRASKIEMKNFHPGYILTATGQKLEGRIAVRGLTSEEDNTFFLSAVLLERSDKYVTPVPAARMTKAVQNVNGKEVIYESYKNGILRHVVEGKIIVMRNPFPTTAREGLNNLVNQVADSAAKKMAEKSLDRNLGDAMAGDTDAQDRISEDLQNAEELAGTDAKFMQNEYLIRNGPDGEITIIKPDNFDRWAGSLRIRCPDLMERKDLARYNRIYELVRFYNSNCN